MSHILFRRIRILPFLLFLLVAASFFRPVTSLQGTAGVLPNDPLFTQQWNLATMRAEIGKELVEIEDNGHGHGFLPHEPTL